MRNILLHALLGLVVAGHMAGILGVLYAMIALPFLQPLEVWVPLEVLLINLVFGRIDCPVTRLENEIRLRLGYRRIGGFVGHYLKKPLFTLLGIRRRPCNNDVTPATGPRRPC